MPNYVENLAEYNIQAIMISAAVPADNRVVTISDIDKDLDMPVTYNARHKQGRWYCVLTNKDLTDSLSSLAIWSESFFSNANSAANWSNEKSKEIIW